MSNSEKGRRWGRKSRRDLDASIQQAEIEAETNYVPPSLSETPSAPSTTSSEYFVTSPPKKAGLTGNISSLFRRAASREPGDKRINTRSGSRAERLNSNGNDNATPKSRNAKVYYQEDEQIDDDVLSARHQSQNNSQAPSSPTRFASSGTRSRSSGGASARSPRVGTGAKIESPMAMAAATGGAAHNRLFYSAQNDDDSQDSFESKASRFSRASAAYSQSTNTRSKGGGGDGDTLTHTSHEDSDTDTNPTNYEDDDETTQQTETKTILRYRGFSTSLKSLFLDEALVCASMGCFGLILSNRTEYLLQIRNDRRGVRWGRSTSRRALPSRIVAYALLMTFVMIALTFVIWGFGTNNSYSSNRNFADGFYDGYDDTDDVGETEQYQEDDGYYNNGNGAYYNGNNDDAAAAQNDDGGNQNYNYNNDDAYAYANNDDANNDDANANNDDANANNDDANANNDDANANNDDANANNDDANANNDDANANNDDANANNDDANANNDDANNANGGDDYYNRRNMVQEKDTTTTIMRQCSHRPNGIFKIRDMNEGLWIPAVDFLKEEWHSQQNDDRRNLEDYGTSSTTTDQAKKRDLAADLRHSFILVFLVVLGILGRRRRMRTRYYLVRARAQEDHLFYASSGVGVKRVAFQDSREDQYEGACSHTLCGCYPTDPPKEGDEIDDAVEVSDDGVTQRKKKRHHEDCVSRGFDCLVQLCCGALCKCWFQCLSISALAQEAREIRLLLPTRFQRIDFITHQPFYEYQKHLNDLRRGWLGKTRGKSGMLPHFNALSRLSRFILGGFFITFVVILATLLLNPRASFSWPDAVVLIATFLQSFFVIYLVHWLFHKSDLSLDAVIKFFAAGFLIAVPSAFFFEGLLVNITLTTAWIGYSLAQAIGGETFVNWFISYYRILWILAELVNAYLVAAVTEELCKYYTFRCVEHPDLIFLTGLDRSSQDDRAIQGGLVKYPFGSHQVQQSNKDFADDMSVGNMSRASHRSVKGKIEQDTLHPSTTDDEFYEDEHDVRTHLQKAAAVTTGMICVAVGLACAENFIYVFLLGGAGANGSKGGIMEEWIVLLFRSVFPVHALAAAMQSVNMIRKFVECDNDNSHRVGVGRIILPAVIMHGSFDAVLLAINVFIETSWDAYLEANEGDIDINNPPYNPIIVNIVAWTSVIFVMLSGLFWYYRENRNQRLRLILLEQKKNAMETDSAPYTNPSELGSPRRTTSELELV